MPCKASTAVSHQTCSQYIALPTSQISPVVLVTKVSHGKLLLCCLSALLFGLVTGGHGGVMETQVRLVCTWLQDVNTESFGILTVIINVVHAARI